MPCPAHDVQQVFLPVQGVMVRAWPDRDRVPGQPVEAEGGVEHALTTGQGRQLLRQLMHLGGGDGEQRAVGSGRVRDRSQPGQGGQPDPAVPAGASR